MMTFRRRFALIGSVVLLGFVALFLLASSTMNTVMVNGPIYQTLSRDKDIISDILPPPEFIVEPYLVVCQMNGAKSPEALKQLTNELQNLEKQYRDGHAAWAQKLSLNAPGNEGVLARELLQESYRSADNFFQIVHGDWKAAIDRGDQVAVSTITMDQLNPLYTAHRDSILKAVTAAQALVAMHETEARETVARGQFVLIAVNVAVLVTILIIGLIILRSVLQSLTAVTNRMRTMAEADADLTARLNIQSKDEVGILAGFIDLFVVKIASVLGGVKNATDSLGGTAVEMHATSQQQETTIHHFGAATTQIAAAVRQITVTGNELVNTMTEVECVVKNSAGLAATSRTGLAEMKAVMQQLADQSASISEKLEQINSKTKDISQVVVTITKVADQTNLLSVNAALEAEKAGEHGRGFLVVAREIRRLADQTASATLDIEHTVKHMQSAVSTGVMEMDKFASQVTNSVIQVETIGQTLTTIIESVEVMKNQFSSVSQGMNSQNLGAKQIGEAMGNLSDNVQVTIQSLGEFTKAADQMKNSVGALNTEVVRFRL
ncbi:MAG: methyl-accepting chemotaxis protein [Phycisphaerales bacterium]|nr:methyl-accepting chemotaxis protein [Phycisphaerales bacterium]